MIENNDPMDWIRVQDESTPPIHDIPAGLSLKYDTLPKHQFLQQIVNRDASLRSEVAALRGALKNMVERFEEKTGERPHNGDMCGCSYCNAKLALKGDDADRPTCLYCKSTEAEWCGPKDGHREYVCLKCAKGMSRD